MLEPLLDRVHVPRRNPHRLTLFRDPVVRFHRMFGQVWQGRSRTPSPSPSQSPCSRRCAMAAQPDGAVEWAGGKQGSAVTIQIHGYAIVSDGRPHHRFDRRGDPGGSGNEADWAYFQRELDKADLVVLGRLGHEANPNTKGRPPSRRVVILLRARKARRRLVVESRTAATGTRPSSTILPAGRPRGGAGRAPGLRSVPANRLRCLPPVPRRERRRSVRASACSPSATRGRTPARRSFERGLEAGPRQMLDPQPAGELDPVAPLSRNHRLAVRTLRPEHPREEGSLRTLTLATLTIAGLFIGQALAQTGGSAGSSGSTGSSMGTPSPGSAGTKTAPGRATPSPGSRAQHR